MNFYPTREFLDEICRRTSTLIFTSEEKSKLKSLSDEKARIFEEPEKVDFDAARMALMQIHVSNERKITAGEPTPSRISRRSKRNTTSSGPTCALSCAADKAQPAHRPGNLHRLAEASKQLAETLQTQEQSEAAKWGQPFRPSAALCAIVWLADDGFKHQATCITGPDNLLFGLFHHADYEAKN